MSVYDNATPRTDALVRDYGHNGYHERYVDLCRQLERELIATEACRMVELRDAEKLQRELALANARIDYLCSPDSSHGERSDRQMMTPEERDVQNQLRSESGETFLGENDYREALMYAAVTMKDLAAGKPVRDLDEQLSRIERLLDGFRLPEGREFEMPNAIWLAKFLHETYERLAPQFGYHTRLDTRQFDHESAQGRLMIAVCEELRATMNGAQ